MEREHRLQYEIRPPTLDDVVAIRSMHAQSWLDTYPNDEHGVSREWVEEETASWLTSEKLDESKECMAKIFADPRHFYRIALGDGEVVGMVHLSETEDGSKRLEALYTAKGTHGTGLAQHLMEAGEAFLGHSDVVLEVVSYNQRAKAFYRKYGFEEMGENELFKGKLPNVTMVRRREEE